MINLLSCRVKVEESRCSTHESALLIYSHGESRWGQTISPEYRLCSSFDNVHESRFLVGGKNYLFVLKEVNNKNENMFMHARNVTSSYRRPAVHMTVITFFNNTSSGSADSFVRGLDLTCGKEMLVAFCV